MPLRMLPSSPERPVALIVTASEQQAVWLLPCSWLTKAPGNRWLWQHHCSYVPDSDRDHFPFGGKARYGESADRFGFLLCGETSGNAAISAFRAENETWAEQTVAHKTLVVNVQSHFCGDRDLADPLAPTRLYFDVGAGLHVSAVSLDDASSPLPCGFAADVLSLAGATLRRDWAEECGRDTIPPDSVILALWLQAAAIWS